MDFPKLKKHFFFTRITIFNHESRRSVDRGRVHNKRNRLDNAQSSQAQKNSNELRNIGKKPTQEINQGFCSLRTK